MSCWSREAQAKTSRSPRRRLPTSSRSGENSHASSMYPYRRRTLCFIGLPDREIRADPLYTFSEQELSVIKQRRGDANRLGFAVLLVRSTVSWPRRV